MVHVVLDGPRNVCGMEWMGVVVSYEGIVNRSVGNPTGVLILSLRGCSGTEWGWCTEWGDGPSGGEFLVGGWCPSDSGRRKGKW